MFTNIVWKNFENCYQHEQYIIKNINTTFFDAKAISEKNISRFEPTCGIQFINNNNNAHFIVGLSNKIFPNVLSYSDLKYYIEFNSNINGYCKFYIDNNLVYTTDNLGSIYEIKFSTDKKILFLKNNEVLFHSDLEELYPFYIYFFGKSYNTPIYIRENVEGVEDLEIVQINPNFEYKVDVLSPIKITFNKYINENSINKNNVLVYENNVLINSYNLFLNNTEKSLYIYFFESRKYDTIYKIILNHISDIDNVEIKYTTLSFITIENDISLIEDISQLTNTNSNDVYYKSKELFNLLNIDTIIYEGEKFNIAYKPAKYDAIKNTYIEDENLQLFNNKKILTNILQNQYLYNFKTYLNTINSIQNLNDKYKKDLLSLLFKNILNINYYKSNQFTIQFITNIFANILGHYITNVVEDPYDRLSYRVESNLPYELYIKNIHNIVHPESFQMKYFQIPYLSENCIDLIKNKVIYNNYNIFNKYYSYIDFFEFDFANNDNYKRYVLNKNFDNVNLDDLYKNKKFPFTPAKYDIKENYNHIDLNKELVIDKNFKISKNQLYLYDEYKIHFYGNIKPFATKYGFVLLNNFTEYYENIEFFNKEITISSDSIHNFFFRIYYGDWYKNIYNTKFKFKKTYLNLNLYENKHTNNYITISEENDKLTPINKYIVKNNIQNKDLNVENVNKKSQFAFGKYDVVEDYNNSNFHKELLQSNNFKIAKYQPYLNNDYYIKFQNSIKPFVTKYEYALANNFTEVFSNSYYFNKEISIHSNSNYNFIFRCYYGNDYYKTIYNTKFKFKKTYLNLNQKIKDTQNYVYYTKSYEELTPLEKYIVSNNFGNVKFDDLLLNKKIRFIFAKYKYQFNNSLFLQDLIGDKNFLISKTQEYLSDNYTVSINAYNNISYQIYFSYFHYINTNNFLEKYNEFTSSNNFSFTDNKKNTLLIELYKNNTKLFLKIYNTKFKFKKTYLNLNLRKKEVRNTYIQYNKNENLTPFEKYIVNYNLDNIKIDDVILNKKCNFTIGLSIL